ncbi:MAG: MotA/TolQ/ExbB proton channel family protein [Bdellovibrionales bacterium]|nr:MotA/TolQ/ExbB proton channel family protein [Bdellovibrionales bacterium]
MFTQLGSMFHQGGFWMFPIMAVQIFSVAIIIERIVALYFRRSADAREMVQAFEGDIKSGNIEKIVSKAEKFGHKPLATIAQIGVQSTIDFGGREELQLKMDEVLIEESGRVDQRLGFLSMLANVATLLGLLGTIVGLIKSFTSIANATAVEKARILAEGIGEAMNATAYGLIVAVPALVAYSILQNRANALTDDLHKAALRMYIWLGFNVENVATKKTRSR